MKKYKYVAININKKKFQGTFLAENEHDLASKLAQQNLYLVKATIERSNTASTFFSTTGKVKIREIATMCRQFAIMLNTGIPIVEALNILKDQSYTPLLKKTLYFIYEDVKGGALLSTALKKHKKIFPNFLLSMVYVGEISGALDNIFITLADYFESDANIKKKTKSALTYPIILIAMAIGIIVLMVSFIIPTFMDAFSSLDINMPPLTIFLNDLSIFFKENWKTIFIYLVSIIALIILFSKTKKGKFFFDMLKVKAPIIGKITLALTTARFARSLGVLLSGGLDVVDSLETVQIVLNNKYIEKRFKGVVEDVRNGMSLTMALQSYNIFPPLIVQMISVGEGSDQLAEVLNRSCRFFDEQAESAITSVTTIIQPVILAIIGGSVGMLFYAIYSPLLEIMNSFGGEQTAAIMFFRLFSLFYRR